MHVHHLLKLSLFIMVVAFFVAQIAPGTAPDGESAGTTIEENKVESTPSSDHSRDTENAFVAAVVVLVCLSCSLWLLYRSGYTGGATQTGGASLLGRASETDAIPATVVATMAVVIALVVYAAAVQVFVTPDTRWFSTKAFPLAVLMYFALTSLVLGPELGSSDTTAYAPLSRLSLAGSMSFLSVFLFFSITAEIRALAALLLSSSLLILLLPVIAWQYAVGVYLAYLVVLVPRTLA